jgi:hypothetical protein
MGVSYYQHKEEEAKKVEAIIAERDRLKERLATMTADRDLLDAAAAKATQENERLREALEYFVEHAQGYTPRSKHLSDDYRYDVPKTAMRKAHAALKGGDA